MTEKKKEFLKSCASTFILLVFCYAMHIKNTVKFLDQAVISTWEKMQPLVHRRSTLIAKYGLETKSPIGLTLDKVVYKFKKADQINQKVVLYNKAHVIYISLPKNTQLASPLTIGINSLHKQLQFKTKEFNAHIAAYNKKTALFPYSLAKNILNIQPKQELKTYAL